ncbi:MAG: LytR C-terminal domain-containing protein [Ignavibacteriales bacterium]|nr:LytR C-terminal domain-containing protein [Ignavibacteriales bacterium]
MKIRLRPSARESPVCSPLTVLIGAAGAACPTSAYSLVDRHVLSAAGGSPAGGGLRRGQPIQVDVLNGCGASGAATAIRDYLRARGFDVVETQELQVLRRASIRLWSTGRGSALAMRRRLPTRWGSDRSGIIQQINPDYFVDVSVVVGRDYRITQTVTVKRSRPLKTHAFGQEHRRSLTLTKKANDVVMMDLRGLARRWPTISSSARRIPISR